MLHRAIRYVPYIVAAQVLASCSFADETWTHRIDTSGYALSLPTGWTAKRDPANGKVTIHGHGSTLAVWPFFLPNRELEPGSATEMDRHLATRSWPGVEWSRAETVSSKSVRLVGSANGRRLIAALAWIPTEHGSACYWYGADFGTSGANLGPTFARILASFTIAGPPERARTGRPRLAYEEHEDQSEHAFSYQAPAGWKVQAAVGRLNPYDDRPTVVESAPDESVILRLNDARIPGFILPSQALAIVGGEGHYYNIGGGASLLIYHFMRPEEALKTYLSRILSQNVQDIEPTGYKDRPDLTRLLQSPYYSNVSVGDITFKCSRNGKHYNGSLECCTGIMVGSTMWGVGYLAGYIAEPGKEREGLSAVVQLIKGFKTNPEWRMRENQRVGALSKQMAAMFDQNRQSIMASWEHKQKIEDDVSHKWELANLGQEEVVDPDTGAKMTVSDTKDYYWIDQSGHVIGTNSPSTPDGADVHRLMAG